MYLNPLSNPEALSKVLKETMASPSLIVRQQKGQRPPFAVFCTAPISESVILSST